MEKIIKIGKNVLYVTLFTVYIGLLIGILSNVVANSLFE